MFRSKQAYVLLGDPGAGKTTEFERECAAMGDAAVILPARDFIALDVDSHPEWRDRTLFIDGLDEVRSGQADVRVPLDEIRGRLDRLGRPRFRVSCREADWIGGNDWQSLKMVSPDLELTVLQLDPLDYRAACALLSELISRDSANTGGADNCDVNSGGIDSGDVNASDNRARLLEAEEFVEQARLRGVGSMLKNPLTLQLLFEAVAYAGEGEWPDNRLETFEKACHRMTTDRNPEHLAAAQTRYLSTEILMSTAGRLCALLLLSDSDGYTLTHVGPADSDVSSGGPRIASLHSLVNVESDAAVSDPLHRGNGSWFSAAGGVDTLIMFKRTVATKLFTATGYRGFVPIHRQIAEFLAGRHLAERIDRTDGNSLSIGRVMALLTSPADGGVPTPLRGLSAWLATHSDKARRRLIKIDPVGVGLYGDIRAFTTSEKKYLLESLGAFAERSSLTGHRRHYGQINGYSEDAAQAFSSLVSADTVPVIKGLLKRSSVTASEERFSAFLLGVLSEADTSDASDREAVADLAPELLGVLRDSAGSPTLALAALNAYIHVAPPGASTTRELKHLLEEVHTGMFPDPQDEIRGTLLCSLYPDEITPSQVWRYLFFREPRLGGGRFWTFMHQDILALSQDSHANELLSTLNDLVFRWANVTSSQAMNSQEQSPDSFEHAAVVYSPYDLSPLSLPLKLLERVLNASDDDLDPSLLYDWLRIASSFSLLRSEELEHTVNAIRVWFEARPGVQKAIYRIWLQRRADPNVGHGIAGIFDYPPCIAMHGSRPSAVLGLWCLKKAVEVLDTDITAAVALIEGAHKSLEKRGECRCFDCVWLELVEGVYKPSAVPAQSEASAVVHWNSRHSRTGNYQLEATNRRIRKQDAALKRFGQAAGARNRRNIADLRKRGRAALEWQLEKLTEAHDAGEFSYAKRGNQRLEQFEEQTPKRQERSNTGADHHADRITEWLEDSIAITEGEEKQKLIKRLRDHNERIEKAEQEKRQITEGWAKLIRSQETELRENRFSPQNLHNLAMAYFNLFTELDRAASPRERISGLVGGDPDLVDAAMTGLRHAVKRDDIPEVDEVIACRNQSTVPWLAYPVLASLHLLSEDEEGSARLDGLNAAQKRKALAVHYYFSSHMFTPFGTESATRPSEVWYYRLFDQEPDLALDVLHRFASSNIRAGLKNPNGLQELTNIQRRREPCATVDETARDTDMPRSHAAGHDDSTIDAKIHDVRLRLIEAYPARSRNDQMESLDHLIAEVLQYADNPSNPNNGSTSDIARLSALAKRKLALKSTTPAQRVRWLTVDLLASPHPSLRKLQDLAAYVKQNEIRIRHLAQFHCNSMQYGYPVLSLLSGSREPAILRDIIAMLGRSFNPLIMNGVVTPAMEISDILSESITQLGSLTTREAHEALTALAADPELQCWHSRLVRTLEDQVVLYRDAEYRHPSISRVQAALNDRAPANAEDLAALLTDSFSDIAEALRGDSSNPWRKFWNEDTRHRRPVLPKHEDSCRDALLEMLRERLPRGLDAVPEGRRAADKRADILVSFGREFNVPIEIKKNSHEKLWNTIHKQLINRYTTDPATSGHGILVVLWFGEQENRWKTTKPTSGERPSTAGELEWRLTETLTDDEQDKISVVVLDVTKPGA